MELPPELERYRRQAMLPEIGPAGQARLAAGHAVVVGCGALGTVASELLVRAGVGRVTIIDRDVVETTNLQRQTLFTEADAREGVPKAEAAARCLRAINSSVRVDPAVADLTSTNAERLLGVLAGDEPGVLVDGTDNFETRFLLNDVSVKHAVPYVYGGAVGTRGMAAVFTPGEGACLRCVFDGPPEPGSQETCETHGVLGALTAMIGAYEAAEAIKLLVGASDRVLRTMLDFDIWFGQRRRLALERDLACPCCAERRFEFLDARSERTPATVCGQDAVQIPGRAGASVDFAALAERLGRAGVATVGVFVVRGEVEGGRYGLTVFRDGRTIVRGTRDVAEARAVHARYVGA